MLSNVEQDAVQFLDSIFCCKHRLYLSQQMNVQMDTDGYLQLHGSVAGGWIWCVCLFLCVQNHALHQVCFVFWDFFLPFYSLSLLAPWITQNAFPPWQPGGLLSLPSCTERGRERGEKRTKQRLWVCVCVCACGSECVSALNVCGGKRRTGGGRRRGSTWPADKAAFSPNTQTRQRGEIKAKTTSLKKQDHLSYMENYSNAKSSGTAADG